MIIKRSNVSIFLIFLLFSWLGVGSYAYAAVAAVMPAVNLPETAFAQPFIGPAAPPKPAGPPKPEVPMTAPLTGREKIEKTMAGITNRVQTFSVGVDRFFSREIVETEDTGSRLRVGYAAKFEEYQDPTYNFILNLRLVLPNTQDKLQLLLDSEEPDEVTRTDNQVATTDANVQDSVRDQKYGLGLRGLFHKSERSAISLSAGVKIRSEIDPYTRLTLRRTWIYGDHLLNFVERLFWFESIDWGSTTTFDFDKRLNADWLFRFGNVAFWSNQDLIWNYEHYLELFQKVSPRTAMSYRTGITSDDDPTLALESYYFAINYRYAILPPWLYFDVVPKLTWPREQDWDRITSVLFKIESTF